MNKAWPQAEQVWLEWASRSSLKRGLTMSRKTGRAGGMGKWVLQGRGVGRRGVNVPRTPGLDSGRLETQGVDSGQRLKSTEYTKEPELDPKVNNANF